MSTPPGEQLDERAPRVAAQRVACSVIIAARDEGAEIADCIASVAWADEVIVVENDSSDDTVQVARNAGAAVFSHPFTTIGRQRNAAIARARNDWILVVDADERATPELRDEVARLVGTSGGASAYRVRRRNFFMGREIRHGGWERDRPVRLFRAQLRYDERPVHEHVLVDGQAGELRAPMLHYPYASLDEYFAKLDRYSRWWAEQSAARGRRVHAWTVALKAPARFFAMYVLRAGFLDGTAGVLVAALAAMSVAAKYARLWELTRAGAVPSQRRPAGGGSTSPDAATPSGGNPSHHAGSVLRSRLSLPDS